MDPEKTTDCTANAFAAAMAPVANKAAEAGITPDQLAVIVSWILALIDLWKNRKKD